MSYWFTTCFPVSLVARRTVFSRTALVSLEPHWRLAPETTRSQSNPRRTRNAKHHPSIPKNFYSHDEQQERFGKSKRKETADHEKSD
jgi:hypothetical protein